MFRDTIAFGIDMVWASNIAHKDKCPYTFEMHFLFCIGLFVIRLFWTPLKKHPSQETNIVSRYHVTPNTGSVRFKTFHKTNTPERNSRCSDRTPE